jgi:hypothetical protein
MHRLLPFVLWLCACSEEPRLQGVVLDIWDNPVAGATVVMDDLPERPLTDRNGKFNLPFIPGKHRLKAGHQAYVQEHQEVVVPEGPEASERVLFRLYRKPERAGFYVVSTADYVHLEPQHVVQKGGDVELVRGIERVGDAYVENKKLKVLFHTPLKTDQVHRLGLRLHRLAYLPSIEMTGPTEREQVPVRLYVSDAEVPIQITPLRSRHDYLIETKDPVDVGEYALDHQDLLAGRDREAFQEIPEPVRKAYPITIR